MVQEFKAFAVRGNVVDMAVGRAAPSLPPAPGKEEQLRVEIRDLLKAR